MNPSIATTTTPSRQGLRTGGEPDRERLLGAFFDHVQQTRRIRSVAHVSELDDHGDVAVAVVARGLTGVARTSDAHAGLVEAIGATLPSAAWQRCRTHDTVNLMSICPKHAWPAVKVGLHSVFEQVDAESVHVQYDRLNKEIRRRTDVIGASPTRDAVIRLVGAALAEQRDEWTEGRRHLGLELLRKARLTLIPGTTTEQEDTTALSA